MPSVGDFYIGGNEGGGIYINTMPVWTTLTTNQCTFTDNYVVTEEKVRETMGLDDPNDPVVWLRRRVKEITDLVTA